MIIKTYARVLSCLLCLGLVILAQKHIYYIGVNASHSLPYTVFFITNNKKVHRGDLIAFNPPDNPFFKINSVLIKKVVGESGDMVIAKNRKFYVNKKYFGKSLPYSQLMIPLKLGPTGIIPNNKFYVHADHVHSYDSRYKGIGWIDLNNVIGKVYPII